MLRTFLKISLIIILSTAVYAKTLTVSQRSLPLIDEVDVLVVGGSSGGVAAAVEAADKGASVYLITEAPYLGADIAGCWRFWEKPELINMSELAKKVFATPTSYSESFIDFEYDYSSEPAGKLTDPDKKRLCDENLYWSHCLAFDSDTVFTLDLGESKKFNIVNLWVNQMYPDYQFEEATVYAGSDKKNWQKIAVIKNDTPGFYRKEPLRLSAEVDSEARYVKIEVKKGEGAKYFGIAEIQLFNNQNDKNKPVPNPLQVKKTLDQALLDAGVKFVFSSYCTDVLRDEEGGVCGILVSNRSGRQAIKAKTIIDATSRAVVARMAGALFTEFPAGIQKFRFAAIGGIDAGEANKKEVFISAQKVPLPLINRGRPYYPTEYWLGIDMKDGSFESIAAAEQQIRSAVWSDRMVRASDMPWQIWPDHMISKSGNSSFDIDNIDIGQLIPADLSNLYVLNSCADMDRKDVEIMMSPAVYMKTGEEAGRHAAHIAGKMSMPQVVKVGSSSDGDPVEGELKEQLNGLRPATEPSKTVTVNKHDVPIDGEYDVVVIGGGTAGAPAGIAAARYGAKTLVVEYLHGLGGIGTEGRIANYWYGNVVGFSQEVDRAMGLEDITRKDKAVNRVWNVMKKGQWWREEVLRAGADLWFGSTGCGAIVDDGLVKGVMIATPSGPRYILAECVVDATGSADIAIAAGASYMFVDGETIAYQGVGLPPTDLYVDYFNTDFAITDDLDTIDTTHLRVYGKNKYKDAFDISSMICSRERRRIVGDFVMTVEDQLARRTYTDSIAHTYSNHDSHASKNALWYFLMARPQKLYCYLPFRCMLPKGLNGIVVTGTGISAQHDAMAILRMQADMQNQGYAAGVAAAMASRQKGSVRAIDVKDLQRHLIAKGNIPASVLTDKDNSQLSLQQIESILPEAVKDYYIETYSERKSENVAPLLVNFDKTMPLIKKKYLESSDESEKLFYAHFMAVFGEDAGIDTLIKAINDTSWDAGGNTLYVSTVDRLVIAAGMAGNKRATASIIDKLNELEPDSPFSHFQAVALALQNLKDPAACKPLADTLAKKGMTGHHVTTIEEADRQDYEARKIQPNEFSLDTRMLCDREIILARALLYSGDHNGLGRKILENYLTDLRGVYAAAARACLIEAEKKN